MAVTGVVAATALTFAQPESPSLRNGTKRFAMRVVTAGLADPWEVAWGPDGMLWVTERPALRITRVDPTTGAHHVAATLDGTATAAGSGGVLGMALHPQLLRHTGHDEVYVAVTYIDMARPADLRFSDPASPFRHLYSKVVRLRYDAATATLVDPVTILDGLPAGNDHYGMRLAFGPDGTLHLTTGDQGGNQLGNYCHPIYSQQLPTQAEVDARDWSAYEGKTLRLTTDGGIPADNPVIGGVRSHVYTYGHRNPQGITMGVDGTMYTSDHGPKSDDEVNVLVPGGNYGWPHVAGYRDDSAYEYARWGDSTTPCASLRFSDLAIPSSVPRAPESAFTPPMVAPLATLFTVPTGHDFEDPACGGVHYLCWPTVAAASVEAYAHHDGIPGWDRVLIVSALKRGSLYVVPLDASGQRAVGPVTREARTRNRYRDTAVHPDGRTIFVATTSGGLVESLTDLQVAKTRDNDGSILAFTYEGEAAGTSAPAVATTTTARPPSSARRVEPPPAPRAAPRGPSPPFSAAQVVAGKAAYDTSCAVCHGASLSNGTFGTPLAGEYFRRQWSGRPVADLFEKAHGTMPPAAIGSLPAETYAAILAYVLEVNGSTPGATDLPADITRLRTWRVP